MVEWLPVQAGSALHTKLKNKTICWGGCLVFVLVVVGKGKGKAAGLVNQNALLRIYFYLINNGIERTSTFSTQIINFFYVWFK